MRFSVEELREILPEGLPPREAVPDAVIAAYATIDAGEDNDLLRRSAFWTYAIFAALPRSGWTFTPTRDMPPILAIGFEADGVRPSPLLSVGALDPEYEAKGFGIILTSPLASESLVLGTMMLPDLGGVRFPVALRALAEDPHAPPALANATTTCWAEDRLSPGHWGFVTCSHALTGIRTGARVPLVGGGLGTVVRMGWPLIDAAFVETSPPTGPINPLPVIRFPTTGLALSIHFGGGQTGALVVGVTNTLGVIGDPHHPIKIYTDKHGQPGDSGSLITSGGDGVGIYCGALSGATVRRRSAQTVGFAQHLEQAATILDFDPYL